MSGKPAALLTKTQRRRLDEDFAGVQGAKRRRDKQGIRERVAAGIDDFRHLGTYPDDQLDLAFEDVPDEELTEALADGHLFLERIAEIRNLEREAVCATAKERASDARAQTDDVDSLAALDLRTPAERRASIATAARERASPGTWKRRADVTLKLGLFFLLVAVSVQWVAPGLSNGPVDGVPGIIGAVLLFVGLTILGLQAVKHDVVPAVRRMVTDPAGAVSDLWERF